MPTLDWLNRGAAFTTAANVPYRLLDTVAKRVIVNRLKLGKASGTELRQLVFDKLSTVLKAQEKETKVKNLRTALRLRGLDGIFIEVVPSGPAHCAGAVWRIKA